MRKISPELIELMHRKLDGETLSGEEQIRLRMGLAASSEARDMLDGLTHVQRELRDLPAGRFPEAALVDILSRTSRASKAPPSAAPAAIRWAALAAAIALLALALWTIRPPDEQPVIAAEPGPDAEQALADLQAVFRLTSSAIDRSAEAALGDVMRKEVSPALRRIPVRFPAASSAQGGGS